MAEEKLPRKIHYVPELFDHLDTLKTKKQRIDAIRAFVARNNPQVIALRGVVRYTYHPDIVMSLPEGEPPYKDPKYTDYSHAPMPLVSALKKRAPRFIPLSNMFIPDDERFGKQKAMKRERVFIQTLESLFEEDAKLFVQVKDKKLSGWKSVNESLFRDALPNWFDWETTNTSTSTTKVNETKEKKDTASSPTETETAPKKRGPGRPRKNSTESKKSTTKSTSTGRKRGRPPKKKPEDSSEGSSNESPKS